VGQEAPIGGAQPEVNPAEGIVAAPNTNAKPAVARLEHGTQGAGGPGIKMNFSNAEITRVINSVMQELGYSYVIDPQVQGNVNIFSMREIPRQNLFAVLEQLLKMNGLAIIKQDELYSIVPINEGPTLPHEILMNSISPGETEAPAREGKEKPGESGKASEPTASPSGSAESKGPQPAGQPPAAAGESGRKSEQPQVIKVEGKTEIKSQGVVTYIIPLHYILSDDMLKMAQVFLSPGSTVVDFAPANLLIVTDYPSNIEQVLSLVDLLDTQYFKLNNVNLISIRFNKAADVAEDLGKIFAPGDSAAGVRIVAIERLNSILVVTRAPEVFQEVTKWIEKLDAPSSTSNIKTYVYHVENSTSVQIAQILAELYQDGMGLPSSASSDTIAAMNQQEGRLLGSGAAGTARGYQEPGFVQGRYSGGGYGGYGGGGYGGYGGGSYGGYGGGGYGGGYGGYGGGGYGGYGGGGYGGYGGGYGGRESLSGGSMGMRQLGPALSPNSQSQIRAIYAGSVKIVVNEFNNSLIIQGTEADIQFILDTIRQLDLLPRQVVIEAQIYSVELRDDLAFGVTAYLQRRGIASTSGANSSFLPATTGSVADGKLTAATRTVIGLEREIQAAITALREKTDVEILEAPRVLALDGTPASINIGAEVPVTSASYGNPLQSGTTNFINSIQFRPTGTTLLIVPRISASGIVTMDLVLEISSATGPALTPTINRNYIQSTFIVRDGQSIGIAGLISDSDSLSKKRVPVLGDVPIIGALFGTTENNQRRFELVIFITPKVINNLPTSAELTLEFKRALKNSYDYINRMNDERQELIEKRRQEELRQQEEQQKKPQQP